MVNIKTVGIVEATKSLREFLENKIPNLLTNSGDIPLTYIDGYLKIKTYEEKLMNSSFNNKSTNNDEIDSKIPFVLLRAGKWEQTIDNGITDRTFKVLIRIVTKNKEEDGYQEITELADTIVEQLTMYPSMEGGYALDTDKITGEIQDELSTGEYWTYVIELNVRLSVVKPRMLETLGYI